MFGRPPNLPVDLLFDTVKCPVGEDWTVEQRRRLSVAWSLASRRSVLASEVRNKALRHTKVVPDLSVGQIVKLRRIPVGRSKIASFWSPIPYVVKSKIGPYTFGVQRVDGLGSVLVRRREDILACDSFISSDRSEGNVSVNLDTSSSNFDSNNSNNSSSSSDESVSEKRDLLPLRRTTRRRAGFHSNVHHLPAYLR